MRTRRVHSVRTYFTQERSVTLGLALRSRAAIPGALFGKSCAAGHGPLVSNSMRRAWRQPLHFLPDHGPSNCLVFLNMQDASSFTDHEHRYECLDAFLLRYSKSGRPGPVSEDCGLLVGVWTTGGLVQTSMSIPAGSQIEFAPTGRSMQGQVISCERDDYGFLVQFEVGQDHFENWFPQTYRPLYIRSADRSDKR
jgi:hypothetical protein